MVFPVGMYGCEIWTINKAECQRIDSFELWCWRRLLRVPWTTRIPNQSILKKINPEYSLEDCCWSSNVWPPDVKRQLVGKVPDAGKDLRQKKKGAAEGEMLDSITDSLDMNLSKLREIVEDRGAWPAAVHGVTKSWTQLSNWTTTK